MSPLRFSTSAGTGAGPGRNSLQRNVAGSIGNLGRRPASSSLLAQRHVSGQTTPDPNRVVGIQMVAQANFQGTWQVSGAQLFIEFPLTMLSGPAQTQIAMQFTRVSKDSLSGVDRFLRPWEWQRVE